MMLNLLPTVILLPFTGVLVDKLHRVKLMMTSDLIQGFLAILITILVLSDHLSMVWLWGYAIVTGTMSAVFQPAYSALRQQVFTPDIRGAANSLTQLGMQGMRLIGPSIGGVLISLFTAAIVFGIDGLTFIISFIFLLFIKVACATKRVKPTGKLENQPRLKTFGKDLLGGFVELKKHAWLWVTISAFAIINVCTSGVVVVILPWLINVHYEYSSSIYGLVVSASGVGSLIGGLLFGLKKTWRHRGILAYLGMSLEALSLFLMVEISWVPGLLMVIALGGMGSMFFGIIWETSLQELVPEEAFGRVVSLDILGSIGLMPLGYLFTGWLAEVIGGVKTSILLASVMTVIIMAALSIPAVRRFE
ncbi:MFS transporter [Pullulanibacillus pueri]|uniref:MFS transporter n=2 Tax=Pullulanibacillus pueri TaxID=1437324 RepID=A0A8J3ELJ8_9BACL|nr:MFS transporter [Pullulanibacillus pueri]